MRVIKMPKKAKPMRGSCWSCKTKIECDKSEAKWLEDRPGDGAYAVKCPTCWDDCNWIYVK